MLFGKQQFLISLSLVLIKRWMKTQNKMRTQSIVNIDEMTCTQNLGGNSCKLNNAGTYCNLFQNTTVQNTNKQTKTIGYTIKESNGNISVYGHSTKNCQNKIAIHNTQQKDLKSSLFTWISLNPHKNCSWVSLIHLSSSENLQST